MTIKKLNNIIYEKFLLQAEEAKEQGMEKLGNTVIKSINSHHEENEVEQYSWGELDRDVYEGLWKLAMNVVEYHGLKSADIEKMNETICILAEKFVEEMEGSLGVEKGKIGPKDEILGQK